MTAPAASLPRSRFAALPLPLIILAGILTVLGASERAVSLLADIPMVQQIVKLSADSFAKEDAFIFADSDTFFVRPWDPNSWIRKGRLPLFREVKPEIQSDMTTSWF